MRAAAAGDVPALRLLLDHGADPSAVTKRRVTALMYVAGFGEKHPELEGEQHGNDDESIEAGERCLRASNVNEVNDEGKTALDIAVAQRRDRFVKFRLENGARSAAKKVAGHNAHSLGLLNASNDEYDI